MRYFKHAAGTWLLANGLHPCFCCLFIWWSGGATDVLLFAFVLALTAGMAFSLPLLLLTSLLLPTIVHARVPAAWRWAGWGLFWFCGTLASSLLTTGFFTPWRFFHQPYLISLPALAAIILAFVWRTPAFEKVVVPAAPAFDPVAWNKLISETSNTPTHES